MVPQELHVGPVDQQLPSGTLLEVFFAAQRSEAPVLADDDLLAARELVLRAAEGFNGCCAVCEGRGEGDVSKRLSAGILELGKLGRWEGMGIEKRGLRNWLK